MEDHLRRKMEIKSESGGEIKTKKENSAAGDVGGWIDQIGIGFFPSVP